jgi:hypothetical protein
MRKRFIIRTQMRVWVASIYADHYDEASGHFYVGDLLVGSADKDNYLVSDSGGRMTEAA